MTHRILVTDGLAENGLALLRREAEVIQAAGLKGLGAIDALVVRSRTAVSREVLAAASPRLRVVGRAGAGLDNIDLQAAREQGVVVVNAPDAGATAVAELTVGLMFSLARRLPLAHASLQRGEWRKAEFYGAQLQGKTLGIIGVGRIGSAVAALAAALGMQVLGFDPNLSDAALRGRGVQPSELEALLAQSEFISLHVPLNDQTRGMIDAARLEQVKPGACLINTARGGVVDESALLRALEAGALAGAALDVFEREPPGQSPLLQHPAVVATPHIGAQTAEAQQQIALDIASEVLAALRGDPLRWRVV
jgi:D-3-phosphoglycerate dehydrogenase